MKQKKQTYKFTNSMGETFNLLPLNPLEQQVIEEQVEAEWVASGRKVPSPPTYDATTAAGEMQSIELKSRDQADTDELRAAWDAYQVDNTEMQTAVGERFMTSCYLCIDADPADYPKWLMRMKAMRIPIPDDEFDRHLLFCRTWVLRSKDDIPGLIFAVSSTVAQVSEEAMRAAQDMFRSQVEKAAASINAPTK